MTLQPLIGPPQGEPDGSSSSTRYYPPAWNPYELDRFLGFATERHLMFVRRVVHRLPQPWTADPVLSSVYICNAYRELDRGSRTVIKHILEPSAADAASDRLFNLYLYRAFNLPETYAALGGYRRAAQWDFRAVEATLLALQAAGQKVFSSAYRSAAATKTPGRGQRTRDWVAYLEKVRDLVPAIWAEIERAMADPDPRRGMERTHRVLQGPAGIGDFFAFQVLLDMMYEPRILPPHFHEDVWSHIGEGAHEGLALLLAQPLPWGSVAEKLALAELREHQGVWMKRAGRLLLGPPLTLANCEFALCEYHKYVEACQGRRPKRTFKVPNLDFSLWDDIPMAFRPIRCPMFVPVVA